MGRKGESKSPQAKVDPWLVYDMAVKEVELARARDEDDEVIWDFLEAVANMCHEIVMAKLKPHLEARAESMDSVSSRQSDYLSKTHGHSSS